MLTLLAKALLLESLFAFLVPSEETDLRRAFCWEKSQQTSGHRPLGLGVCPGMLRGAQGCAWGELLDLVQCGRLLSCS